MIVDLEDNPTLIGNYVFEKHEGDLILYDEEENFITSYHPVDFFSDLMDALNKFKNIREDIIFTAEEFKQIVEGSAISMYVGQCEKEYGNCPTVEEWEGPCDVCKYHRVKSAWVNFNRYDFIKDYGKFRRLVLIRDDYKCLVCGNDNENDLQVHHIRSFKDNLELATSVKNGVTLCKDCHTKYHKKYGWKNAKQETFSKFIKENIE